MDKKLFLLDAYALIYRAYYAFIRNPRFNSKGLNTSAIFGFTNTLIEVLQKEQPTHIAVVFDPPGPTFRNEMYDAYKANRPPAPEEIKQSVPWIKKVIEGFNIPVVEVMNYEADDTIGTIAKIAEKEGFEVYMMTPDKDYAQLLTDKIFMYKPARSGNDAQIIGINELKEFFGVEKAEQVIEVLALWGDASDNIPGAPGIGEKTARKLINEYGDIEGIYDNIEQLKGKQKENLEASREQLKQSKELVTIALDVPVEFNEKEYKVKSADKAKLSEVLEDLEFRTTLARISSMFGEEDEATVTPATAKIAPADPMQGSLFGDSDFGAQAAPVKETADIQSSKHKYILVDTAEKRKSMVFELLKQKEVCFDTETTNIDANMAELVGIAFSFEAGKAWYVPTPENKGETAAILEDLKPVLENPEIIKIGQNIKYDILVLKWHGIEVKGDLFDTMIAHYVMKPELIHNLNYLSEHYLNYKPVSIETLIGKKGKTQLSMRTVPIEKITEYACEDADLTYQLKEIFAKELEDAGVKDLFYNIEMPLIYVLAEMEKTGVKLDTSDLDRFAEELRNEIIDKESKIYGHAGMEFNISSPKQLGEVLFDRMKIGRDPKKSSKSGQYSTSEDVLTKLKDKHEVIEQILDYRSLKKLLSTYVEALPKLINEKTGKIHTSFNQAVTTTGRLSSNNPNLQNIPIREERGREIRKSFVPSDGNIFFSADYSQVELRLMAHLSEDPSLIEAFNNDEDIHTATAAKINKITATEVTKEMRSNAKSANFGIIYGISAFGLAQNLNISRSEAKKLIDSYFESYPKVKEYMDNSIKNARDLGYVETIFKRRRNLKVINSRNPIVRGNDERNAINAPIQGSAADIIKIAMIRIFEKFNQEGLRSKMVLQVHDELNFDVVPGELEKVEKIVGEEMMGAAELKVPLTVDSGKGSNWLEAH